ncbi:hypothetical protein [Ottowia sp.]|uniref:hypothetical protein n=1 Tax=Ottowia sp. TaxID=1898956 RepID=UPI0025D6971E|nr:hypothetical protein [Ottowia sp.]MBK6616222.1 hypothetical protein [Ottowia sp.]
MDQQDRTGGNGQREPAGGVVAVHERHGYSDLQVVLIKVAATLAMWALYAGILGLVFLWDGGWPLLVKLYLWEGLAQVCVFVGAPVALVLGTREAWSGKGRQLQRSLEQIAASV